MKLNKVFIRYCEVIKNKVHENADLCFVALMGVIIFCVSSFICTPREFTDDDWGIANYFAGVIDSDYATPYNKFINFIWGWVMYVMYQVIPGPNWFIVIQEIIVVFSFNLFQYMLIQKMKKYIPIVWCYILTSAFLISFEPSYISRLEFTQTAAIGSFMGMMWIIFSYERKIKVGFIGGVIMTVVSALHRFGAFEMCMPFVAVVLIHYTLEKNGCTSLQLFVKGLVSEAKLYLTFLGIIISCLLASKINGAIYNSAYYAEYNAFNSARASVLDYPKARYSDIENELVNIGVSENDYNLMTSWTFADLSFFTTELFRQVGEVEPKASEENDFKEINSYFINLLNPEIMYNKLFYLCLIVLGICILLDLKHMIIYSPILIAGTIIIEIYFTIVVKRYPSYVRTGLLFALIVTPLMIVDLNKLSIFKDKGYLIILALALIVGLYPLGDDYILKNKGIFEYNMDGLEMYKYMNNREDDIFMIPTGENGGLPALRNSYSIFAETEPGIMRHTIGLGGWSTNNPWINDAYSSWGIDYPMSQVADENVYLVASVGKVDSLRTYLKEHRGMDTSASLSAVEYGATIYKLSDNNWVIDNNINTSKMRLIDCTYDDNYGTYDIRINIESIGDNRSEKGRVYLMLTDYDGANRFFMVYNGHNIGIQNDTDLLAKIPAYYIENGANYELNVMLQDGDENYLLCEEGVVFNLNENLN